MGYNITVTNNSFTARYKHYNIEAHASDVGGKLKNVKITVREGDKTIFSDRTKLQYTSEKELSTVAHIVGICVKEALLHPNGNGYKSLETFHNVGEDGLWLRYVEAMVQKVRRIAYERYQLQWMMDHGFSMNDLFLVSQIWAEGLEDDPDTSFQDFLEEGGIGQGSLWVCFDEFMDAEYREREYMTKLLEGDSENLFLYDCDIANSKSLIREYLKQKAEKAI